MDPGSAAHRKRAALPPGNAEAERTHNPKERTMQVNPYLFYNGNCEAALKYYQKVLGAKIDAMLTYEGGPDEMQIPADYKNKGMPAKITIHGEVIMASDAPPGHFHPPQGFSVSLQVPDPADAE